MTLAIQTLQTPGAAVTSSSSEQPYRPPADVAARRIAAWLDLMDTSEKLLLAGLRRKIGPDGDLQAAYREWYAEKTRDHDEAMLRLVHALARLPQEPSDGR